MGVLVSKLFTEGDPFAVQKLEDCATGRPNEVFSHFTQGQSGEHIRRVQQALKNAQDLDPDLADIPPFAVNGGQATAFKTDFPVRVTRFISCQIIGGAAPTQPTDVVPQLRLSFGVITMQYRSDDFGPPAPRASILGK